MSFVTRWRHFTRKRQVSSLTLRKPTSRRDLGEKNVRDDTVRMGTSSSSGNGRAPRSVFFEEQGIYRVPASSGEPERLDLEWQGAPLFESRWVHFLPDGEHFLVTSYPENDWGVFVGSLESNIATKALDASSAVVYAPPGYVLYFDEGNLMARRLATEVEDPTNGESDVWILETDRGVATRFTSEPWKESSPVRSKDDRLVAYERHGGEPGEAGLSVRKVQGSKLVQFVPLREGIQFSTPRSWTPDGALLASVLLQGSGRNDYDLELWRMRAGEEIEVEGLLTSPFSELNASLSPDGNWIGFRSGEHLMKAHVDGTGGSVIAETGASMRGADWGPDGTIVYSQDSGLMKVLANGSMPEVLTRVDADAGERFHYLLRPYQRGLYAPIRTIPTR